MVQAGEQIPLFHVDQDDSGEHIALRNIDLGALSALVSLHKNGLSLKQEAGDVVITVTIQSQK